MQVAPPSKIPAPLLVGGGSKKSKDKKEKKFQPERMTFNNKPLKKLKKLVRPKQTSPTSSGRAARRPTKRQAFSHLLSEKKARNIPPVAEDFSKDFGPQSSPLVPRKHNSKVRRLEMDPFEDSAVDSTTGGPLFAGAPGGPESKSYFDLMGDFFDNKPDINVFEEVSAASPRTFPNFPPQDLDADIKERFPHPPPPRPSRRTRPRPGFGNEIGGGGGPEFGTGSGFSAGPEFEALKEDMGSLGESPIHGDGSTPLYHPYAEPPAHFNPLDTGHDEADVEIFAPPKARYSNKPRLRIPPPTYPTPKRERLERENAGGSSGSLELFGSKVNIDQVLDDHTEHNHPIFDNPHVREVQPFEIDQPVEALPRPEPLRQFKTHPTGGLDKPKSPKKPKIFDYDPPIYDFSDSEPLGGPAKVEPPKFRVFERPPPTHDHGPYYGPDFSDRLRPSAHGPRPFSLVEINGPIVPPEGSRGNPSRARAIPQTPLAGFSDGNRNFFQSQEKLFGSSGPVGSFEHVPSHELPAEPRNIELTLDGPPEPLPPPLASVPSSPSPPPSPPPRRPPPPPSLPRSPPPSPPAPSYRDFEPVVEIPHLPPPPGLIEAMRNSNFGDIPKLSSKMPYFPPEMIYDAFHGGDDSLEVLTHNSLNGDSDDDQVSLEGLGRRSDRLLGNPFKSLESLGQNRRRMDRFEDDEDVGFMLTPNFDANNAVDNRDNDDTLKPFSDFEMAFKRPAATPGVPRFSRPRPPPPRVARRPSAPRTPPPPRFQFDSKDALIVGQFTAPTFRQPDPNPYDHRHMKERLREAEKKPFMPSEEDFFSGLDRPAEEQKFDFPKEFSAANFDELRRPTKSDNGAAATRPPRILRATRPPPSRPSSPEDTSAPVYVPQRKYRHEPPKPEVSSHPSQEAKTSSSESGGDGSSDNRRMSLPPPHPLPGREYLEFDPMAFSKRGLDLQPVEGRQLESRNIRARSLDLMAEEDLFRGDLPIPMPAAVDRRKRGRALFGPLDAPPPAPAFGVTGSEVERPHHFVHVDGYNRFKAGHHRGNEKHHIQDVQEHNGPHHKEEVIMNAAAVVNRPTKRIPARRRERASQFSSPP